MKNNKTIRFLIFATCYMLSILILTDKAMKKYQTIFSILLLSIAILCIGSCTKKNEIEKPVVETVQVIDCLTLK